MITASSKERMGEQQRLNEMDCRREFLLELYLVSHIAKLLPSIDERPLNTLLSLKSELFRLVEKYDANVEDLRLPAPVIGNSTSSQRQDSDFTRPNLLRRNQDKGKDKDDPPIQNRPQVSPKTHPQLQQSPSDDDDDDDDDDDMGESEQPALEAPVSPARSPSPVVPSTTPTKRFSHVSTSEYPNGDVTFSHQLSEGETDLEARTVGWAMNTYGHHKKGDRNTYNRSCLGIYQCPMPKCQVIERPRIPRASGRNLPPLPPKKDCKMDGSTLVHVPCQATLSIVHEGGWVRLRHRGEHNHAKPSPLRPDFAARKMFEDIVARAPNSHPKQLLAGSDSDPALPSIHVSFANLDRTCNLRRKLLKKVAAPSPTTASLELGTSDPVPDRRFFIQKIFTTMTARTMESCIHTDSVHGTIGGPNGDNMNVVFTLAYCPILGRAVPLVVSVLYGASHDLYHQHYAALLKALPFSTWGEFKDGFPGFPGGFSDAERVGFESALRSHFDTRQGEPIHLEDHYLCDHAHFVRSVSSVSKDEAVIPPPREMNFYFRAKALLNSQHTETTFRKAVTEMLEDYPKARNWLKWHLAPSRGRNLFPASTSIDWEFSENTDLQEGLGGDFQMSVGNQKTTVEETLDSISRHINQAQGDYVLATNDISVLVGQPKVKRPYNKISRAPNTTDTPSTRSGRGDHTKKPKLTKGTKQDSSTLGPEHRDNSDNTNDKNSWQSFGMPWGFSFRDLQVTNTCSLDTTLMAWYFLKAFYQAAIPLEMLAGTSNSRVTDILCQVMEKIQAREWDRARWIWCKEILHLGTPGQNSQSLWSSLSEAFLENIPGISRIQVTRSTVCSSKACPRSFKRETLVMDSVMVQNARQINQENLDASLSFVTARCSEKIDARAARRIDEADIRKVAFRDVDTGEDNEWFICNGKRTEMSSHISKSPYLLVLNCLEGWHSGSKDGSVDIQTPQSTLAINGTSYSLAAIFYGNNQHFCCSVMARGKAIFYDGISQPRVQITDEKGGGLPESHQGKGYQFDQVWYLRTNPSTLADAVGPTEPAPLGVPGSLNSMDDTLEKVTSPPPVPMEEQHSKDGQVSQSRIVRRGIFPVGLSVDSVAKTGPLPTCAFCRQIIVRGQTRFIFKEARGKNSWNTATFLHFNESCLRTLPLPLQPEAKRLLLAQTAHE